MLVKNLLDLFISILFLLNRAIVTIIHKLHVRYFSNMPYFLFQIVCLVIAYNMLLMIIYILS
jgi:hypothetical protein